MFTPKKRFIAWMVAALLGFAPTLVLANTGTVSTMAIPAQQSAVGAPTEIENSSDLKVEVTRTQGEAVVQKNGQSAFEPLTQGMILHTGDTVKTSVGTCQLLVDGKAKITVEPISVLKITEALRDNIKKTESTTIELASGRIKISLPKLKGGSTFEVVTPTALAAVRGTTFFVMAGILEGQKFTQLYVDESKGGVFFKNLISGNSHLVPDFSISNAASNGNIDPPKELSPEQQKEFMQHWENNNGPAQQFGVEEVPNNGGQNPPPNPLADLLPDKIDPPQNNDASLDKLGEQNIPGSNGLNPPPLSTPPADTPPADTGITDEEKGMVLSEVNRLVADSEFDAFDANAAQTADAQTGKVFKDVHGNRVRVDQYIFQSSPSSVALLSLTQRSGDYQNGITAMLFLTQFNRSLEESDGPFRSLPWNDYLNVVRRNELTGANVPGQYEQFIVHEHYLGEDEPSLFPLFMGAMFTSAISEATDLNGVGAILFEEDYSNPFRVQADQGLFWVQGLDHDSVTILQGNGDFVFSESNASQPTSTQVNDNFDVSTSHRHGSQTTGFASDPNIANMSTVSGLDAFRNAAVHPSFFEDIYGGERYLYGVFLPINDEGQVIDAPGFDLKGLRDVVYPNTEVPGGGNYNLEMIFAYGTVDGESFSEKFRIDAIITPEIFGRHEIIGEPGVFHPGYGLRNPDGSRVDTIFPSSLDTGEDV